MSATPLFLNSVTTESQNLAPSASAAHILSWKYPVQDLEAIIEHTQIYKTKALLSRGAFEWFQGGIEPALYFYMESLKTVTSISDYIEASRCIATAKAIEGFHNSALKDLESDIPFLRYVEPKLYYDFLNSYAVELGEAGRKYEARNVIKHVLASPFINAYPEWRETAEELKEPNRSFAVVSLSPLRPHNVLSMPALERDRAEFPAWAGQPAPVLSYEKWKQYMAKKKNGKKRTEQMTEADMIMGIINIYASEDTTDAQRRKIYDAVIKAMSEPDKPDTPASPDDDNPGA